MQITHSTEVLNLLNPSVLFVMHLSYPNPLVALDKHHSQVPPQSQAARNSTPSQWHAEDIQMATQIQPWNHNILSSQLLRTGHILPTCATSFPLSCTSYMCTDLPQHSFERKGMCASHNLTESSGCSSSPPALLETVTLQSFPAAMLRRQ